MKIFTKVHLINWHYIEYRTLDLVKGINFFTGKTGAGKSTVIDAIQLLLLGDTDGNFFNKAANDNSKRTLIEYLRGMTQENEADGKKYLRNDDLFNTYVVMEYEDTLEMKRNCIGILLDVFSKTNEYKPRFFHLNQPLPENGFVEDGYPMGFDRLKKIHGNNIHFYSSNTEYRNELLQKHMGAIRKEFFELFKKAVAFKPPKDIREFITSYVCEAIPIDVEAMKENVRVMRGFETKATQMKEEIRHLQDIEDAFSDWTFHYKQKKLNDYAVKKIEVKIKENLFSESKDKVEIWKEDIVKLKSDKALAEEKGKKYEEKKEELHYKIASSKANLLEKQLQDNFKNVNEKINKIDIINKVYTTETIVLKKWIPVLQEWNNHFDEEDSNAYKFAGILESIESFGFKSQQADELLKYMDKKRQVINSVYVKTSERIKTNDWEVKKLQSTNENLKNGIKDYPNKLVELRDAIKLELSGKYGKDIEVNILADIIDIKNPDKWGNAVEGYMNTQKLYLIVAPEYYNDAAQVYKSLDSNVYHGIGIVDIGKMLEQNIRTLPNSLAEEVITDSQYARIYIDYLLGGLIKCSSIDDLRNYRSAITEDCFVYKGFILNRINPEFYLRNIYIGKHSNMRKIKMNEEMINEFINEKNGLSGKESFLRTASSLKLFNEDDFDRLYSNLCEISLLQGLRDEKAQLLKELQSIDMSIVLNLKKELEGIDSESKKCIKLIEELAKNVGIKEQAVESEKEKMRDILLEIEQLTIALEKQFNDKQFLLEGEEFVRIVCNTNKKLESVKRKCLEDYAEEDGASAEKFKLLIKRREDYYTVSNVNFGFTSVRNDSYTKRLMDFIETRIPEYEDLIKNHKIKTYQEFQEDLIYKIGAGISNAERDINDLNRALSAIEFGNKKYKFAVNGSTKYKTFYKMFTDPALSMPNSLFSLGIDDKYKDEINQLFSLITDVGDETMTESELKALRDNMSKFLDYRTYLEFDLIEISDGNTSNLSKTISKTSGGETQMPFYIAVLASFVQIYRMKKKDREKTMRLVVFDEAFSKMDEEHIRMSLTLMKEQNFQSIIVAPDDKIETIGFIAEKLFFVENQNKQNIAIYPFEKEMKDEFCMNY